MTHPVELREVERVARESYGKLLAITRRTGDVTVAEDALGEALANAIETWPVTGLPASPEGWLVTAACRRAVDSARRDMRQARAVAELVRLQELVAAPDDVQMFPDERLPVLFMCAHPRIEASIRARSCCRSASVSPPNASRPLYSSKGQGQGQELGPEPR
jgi:RNA polymerase sigma-70 factor, ECF subfamily